MLPWADVHHVRLARPSRRSIRGGESPTNSSLGPKKSKLRVQYILSLESKSGRGDWAIGSRLGQPRRRRLDLGRRRRLRDQLGAAPVGARRASVDRRGWGRGHGSGSGRGPCRLLRGPGCCGARPGVRGAAFSAHPANGAAQGTAGQMETHEPGCKDKQNDVRGSHLRGSRRNITAERFIGVSRNLGTCRVRCGGRPSARAVSAVRLPRAPPPWAPASDPLQA